MRVFSCPACGGRISFGNTACACGHEVLYDSSAALFVLADGQASCSNRTRNGCNWMAPAGGLCWSCSTTSVFPDQAVAGNDVLWTRAEAAKRWVYATLSRWGWLTDSDAGQRPEFHMLAEATRSGRTPIVMGHDSGLITINVQEADPAERIQRREMLAERLRTMNAHFRHEISHFLFERLSSEDQNFLSAFRRTFGDERADYRAALDQHYAQGAPPGWRENHVTPYAASHPHEDWAETAAHIMHLTDIVDSAVSAGLYLPWLSDPEYDAYAEQDSARLINAAVEIGIAANHINRSMGLDDLYPFVLSDRVREKLEFAHRHLAGHFGRPAKKSGMWRWLS